MSSATALKEQLRSLQDGRARRPDKVEVGLDRETTGRGAAMLTAADILDLWSREKETTP